MAHWYGRSISRRFWIDGCKQVHLFERSDHGKREARSTILDLDDPQLQELLDRDLYEQLQEELEMLEELGGQLDLDWVHQGQMTPIFFGSAMTNFGVELFLQAFMDYALKPGGYNSTLGVIKPTHADFSGFVFKLQANMDPKHRDRVAFVRVCSGKFEKRHDCQPCPHWQNRAPLPPPKIICSGTGFH